MFLFPFTLLKCSTGAVSAKENFWRLQGNPRVYKALRDQLAAVLDELRRIEAGGSVNDELLDTIRMITTIMNGMQEDFAYDR